MKKIIICVLSLSIIIVGALSVAALSKDEISAIENKENLSIQSSEVTSSGKVVDLKTLNTQKENIFNNILNCVDYYDSVKGTFETTFIDSSPTTISYNVNIPKQISLQEAKSENIHLNVICKDGTFLEADNNEKKYIENRFIPQYDETKRKKHSSNINEEVELFEYRNYEKKDVSRERVRKNANGEMEYYYRTDITNASMAATSINPQNLVFGFMSEFDSWKVTGTDEYLGRQVIVIKGKTADKAYANKLKVDVFEMQFDLKTGILLDFKGYLSDETLTQYLTTTEFSVDQYDNTLNKEIGECISFVQSSYEKMK